MNELAPPAPARLRSRRWPWLAAALAVVGLLAVYGVHRARTPAPPEVPLDAAEPAVAAAITAAQETVRQEPRSADAWGKLGMTLEANGYTAAAQTCYERAEGLDPAAPIWPYLRACWSVVRDREAAEPALRRAAERADRADPGNATPHLVLAEVLFEKGELREAEALCQQVLARDPDNARAFLDLGLMALAADDPERSIEALSHCAVNPFTARRASVHLAAAYRRLGDTPSAETFARRADELPADRSWPDAYRLAVKKHAAGRQARLEQAEQHVEAGRHADHLQTLRFLATETGDGIAHAELGIALAKSGDLPAAEPVLRNALAKAPGSVGAHFALGIVLMRQAEQLENGRDKEAARTKYQEAADRLRHATELKPSHGPAHLYLGRCLLRLDRSDDALAAFAQAVLCRPDLAEGHLALGEALAERGRTDDALPALERARSLAPGDPRPGQALDRLRRIAPTVAVPD